MVYLLWKLGSYTTQKLVKELSGFQRLADYLWRSGLIPEPNLKALTRGCNSISRDTWSKLEKENYTQCIGSVVYAEAPSRQPVNLRNCGSVEPFLIHEYQIFG
jgi:hypothetical protein